MGIFVEILSTFFDKDTPLLFLKYNKLLFKTYISMDHIHLLFRFVSRLSLCAVKIEIMIVVSTHSSLLAQDAEHACRTTIMQRLTSRHVGAQLQLLI